MIDVDGYLFPITLHNVFAWSPFTIEDPGLDGRAKLFHTTFEIEPSAMLPIELTSLHFKPMSSWLWGTDDTLELQSRDGTISAELFNQKNTSKLGFSEAYFSQYGLSVDRVDTVKKELKTLKLYRLGVDTGETLSWLFLIRFIPHDYHSVLPPTDRLLEWGGAIIDKRIDILEEELSQLKNYSNKEEPTESRK